MHTPPRLLAVFAFALLASGCIFPKTGPAPGPLTAGALAAAQQRWPDATAESLERGREAFVDRCDACHGYPALDAVSEAEWPDDAARMAEKAELPADVREHLVRFILAAAAAPAAPAPAPAPAP